MKEYIVKLLGALCLLLFTPLFTLEANDSCRQTMITIPKYCGGFYGDFTWLYMMPAPTDADLEAGTFLTLTDDPANLHAVVQQIEPDRESAYRVNLGYQMPCTNCDFTLGYFHYSPSGSIGIDDIDINQFFQNFLGASYTTLDASGRQEINQVDFIAGKRFIIDRCLTVHPYVGLTYVDIRRKMKVKFTDLFLSEDPSDLRGTEKSDYCGVGPIIGTDFSYPIFSCLSLEGRFGGGVLFGNIKSKVDSEATDSETVQTFDAKESYCRAVTVINSQLALVFRPKCQVCNLGFELKAGYEADYYFKAVDRIDPFNGYVVNTDTFPVKTSSNLGIGGPFVQFSVVNVDFVSDGQCETCCIPHFDDFLCGFYGGFTSSWLKPVSNNEDLVYATLNKENGSSKDQEACFDYSWSGTYELGFRNRDDFDFKIAYFHLDDTDSTSVEADEGEEIFSIDASGPAFIAFSEAESKVEYDLDQVECLAGKCFSPFCNTQLLLSFGLRYASLKRTMHNEYDGGVPSETTESKSAVLKSKYYGLGPVFAVEPSYSCSGNLRLTGRFSLALLMGHLKSTLDQVNQGDIGESSNTLRTPQTRYLVPVVDAGAGLSYNCCLPCGVTLNIEAGYQFTDYFRAINLVYPTFLTGLEQRNSDLKLHGPYVALKLGNF